MGRFWSRSIRPLLRERGEKVLDEIDNGIKFTTAYLEVLLLQQLLAPVKQKGSTNVELEHCKTIRLGQISVPQSNSAVEREFSRQKIVHPAEAELKIVDSVSLEMFMKRHWMDEKLANSNLTLSSPTYHRSFESAPSTG